MPPHRDADATPFATGVLNLNKPAGETSFSAVNRLRRLTGARRVGHAGTLDPLATGVLPVLFESATRLAEYAHALPKTYVADIVLGFITDTDDAEAPQRSAGDPSSITAPDVESALAGFVGRVMQRPPAYSAVKVDGTRAYRLARGGEPARPEPREVDIYSARLLEFEPGVRATATVEVTCGSGTYLRSIARDLGEVLGVGGYLGRLVRVAYGPLSIDTAVRFDVLANAEAVREELLPAEVILPEMEQVRLSVEQLAQVRQGRSVRVFPEPRPGRLRAHDASGRLVALGHTDALRRTFVPEKVLT